MQFPVSNKEEAYIRIFAIELLIICAAWLFYTIFQDSLIFYYLGVLLLVTFLPSLFYIRKQNVKSLILDHDTLTVCHNEKTIQIRANEIKSVYSGIGGIDFRLSISKRDVILLNTEYPFGNKLHITYRDSNPSRSFLEEDPQEIRLLKQVILNVER
jgi:hypothetical protein